MLDLGQLPVFDLYAFDGDAFELHGFALRSSVVMIVTMAPM
jgi:hypothetical protein